jgi:nucleoside-diphosphate-sugar epimerase
MDLVPPSFEHNACYLQGDIRKEEDIRKAIEGKGIRRILSLAAKHHDFGVGHDEYFDTNEGGTAAICSVASEFNIEEIVFFSSVAVYGSLDHASSEGTVPKPDSPYGRSKLAGEELLRIWAVEGKSRKVLIIRPAVVFGPNNFANMFKLIGQIDAGLYAHIGKANNIKSIAYVENLVEGTLFLMDRMEPGMQVYNYADEPQLTVRQISETLARRLGRKIRYTIPRPLAILAGLPFDALSRITGKDIPISTARIRKLCRETLHDGSRIFSEGFSQRMTTEEGLASMVDWYKSISLAGVQK